MDDEQRDRRFMLVAESISRESDRGCAILGASLLEEALEDLLTSSCRQDPRDVAQVRRLFQGFGPIASFGAKLQIAFAFGLLPRDLRDDADLVRQIRNEFAHQWAPLDFNTPKIKARLERFERRAEMKIADDEMARLAADELAAGTAREEVDSLGRRVAFGFMVQSLIARISVLASFAREGKDLRAVVLAREAQDMRIGRK